MDLIVEEDASSKFSANQMSQSIRETGRLAVSSLDQLNIDILPSN